MRSDRRRLLLGAAAAATTGAAVVVGAGDPAAALGTVQWIDVTAPPYRARGDGRTDDTAAIRAALAACAPGGTVQLPGGTYLVSAPLLIPPQVTLQGAHMMHLDTTPCAITPGPDFRGTAVLLLLDRETGGHRLPSNEQRTPASASTARHCPAAAAWTASRRSASSTAWCWRTSGSST